MAGARGTGCAGDHLVCAGFGVCNTSEGRAKETDIVFALLRACARGLVCVRGCFSFISENAYISNQQTHKHSERNPYAHTGNIAGRTQLYKSVTHTTPSPPSYTSSSAEEMSR